MFVTSTKGPRFGAMADTRGVPKEAPLTTDENAGAGAWNCAGLEFPTAGNPTTIDVGGRENVGGKEEGSSLRSL